MRRIKKSVVGDETRRHRRRRILKLSAVVKGAKEDKHCRRRRGKKLSVIGEGAKLNKQV
jgi:hypothetical protein